MRKEVFLFIVFVCFVSKTIMSQTMLSNSQATCYLAANTYSFTHNAHTYKLVKELRTWANAAACAGSDGGYLAEVTTQAEQTAIYNGIVASGVLPNYKPVSDGGGASYVWIGGSDSIIESSWFWDGDNDGITFYPKFWAGQGAAGTNTGSAQNGAYNNWGGKSTSVIQEPDDFGSNQDALAIALGTWPYGIAGEWNDISSINTIYYLVEYNGILTGVKEWLNDRASVTLSPNPSNETVSLISDQYFKTITITSVDGKMVREIVSSQKSLTIDISELTEGIYFVMMTLSNGEVVTKKIVKK